jgi:hypothetical protein
MSMGYDVGDLLAEIKAKDAEIARLIACSLNLTEPELKLTMVAIREVHTPERVQHSMSSEAAAILQKLQASLDRIENERRAATDFAASLTDEEREIIKARRAAKSSASR